MARLEHIRHRLEEWADWSVRKEDGARGFPRRSMLLALPSSGYRETIIPIITSQAEETDRAVQALKMNGKGHLFKVIECVYLKGMTLGDVAMTMQRSRQGVMTLLYQADATLDALLQEWAQRDRAQK
jgi:DNA-directed RNA polymerase specialized sigma24 family protein